jgi:hypothetical protein
MNKQQKINYAKERAVVSALLSFFMFLSPALLLPGSKPVNRRVVTRRTADW